MKFLAYFLRWIFRRTPLKKFYPLFQKRVFGPVGLFNHLILVVKYGNGRIKLRLADWIQHHIFFMGEYDEASMRWLENNLRSGDVVIDVGANIGAFTLKMSSLVGETGLVLAFEPHPYNAFQLQENIYINSTQFNSIQLNSTQFNSIQLNSTQFNSKL